MSSPPSTETESPASSSDASGSGAAAYTENATKIYDSGEVKVKALSDVSIKFQTAQFTAIMGASGSGKSTLMHCSAGLEPLSSGKAFIGDTDLSTLSERGLTQLRREKVSFIFQAFNLITTLSARENIVLPLALAGSEAESEWFDTVIEKTGLGHRLGHLPTQLSGGEQQRVAVARALLSRPGIVYADEPTGNLDSANGKEVLTFLRDTVDTLNQTIVMVTHDPGAAVYCDRVIFLKDGHQEDDVSNPTMEEIRKRI